MPRQTVMESKLILAHDLAEAMFTGGPDDLAVIHVEAPAAFD